MARTDPQINVRLPKELLEQLQEDADKNSRALKGEIVHRLTDYPMLKGLAGGWSNGFRSGWDAKAREVEAARLRTVEADNARLRSEVERLTRERDEAQAGWKTASELLDAAVGDYNTEHVALTALTARTREVLAPFAEWFPEEALRRVPPDQRLMTTGLEARHFRAANTLFNELKEKDNG